MIAFILPVDQTDVLDPHNSPPPKISWAVFQELVNSLENTENYWGLFINN